MNENKIWTKKKQVNKKQMKKTYERKKTAKHI